jgi:transketolase
MAIVSKRENKGWKVYSVMGDGEMNEGQVWEALLLAAKYKLSNLVAVIDRNNIQIDGTSDDVLPLEPLAGKLRSFGWNTIEIDGNDVTAILGAFEAAKRSADKPTAIIAKTMPGKGVSFMEGKFEWHGKTPTAEQAVQALKELEEQRKKLEAVA